MILWSWQSFHVKIGSPLNLYSLHPAKMTCFLNIYHLRWAKGVSLNNIFENRSRRSWCFPLFLVMCRSQIRDASKFHVRFVWTRVKLWFYLYVCVCVCETGKNMILCMILVVWEENYEISFGISCKNLYAWRLHEIERDRDVPISIPRGTFFFFFVQIIQRERERVKNAANKIKY